MDSNPWGRWTKMIRSQAQVSPNAVFLRVTTKYTTWQCSSEMKENSSQDHTNLLNWKLAQPQRTDIYSGNFLIYDKYEKFTNVDENGTHGTRGDTETSHIPHHQHWFTRPGILWNNLLKSVWCSWSQPNRKPQKLRCISQERCREQKIIL